MGTQRNITEMLKYITMLVTWLWLDKILQYTCTEWYPASPWLPILVIHIRSTEDKVKVTNLKKNAKNPNFLILQEILHAAHFLKLLDKMDKYERDPTRTVGAIERTRDAGQTDGQTDGRMDRQTDGVKPIYPPTTSFCWGYDYTRSIQYHYQQILVS